MSFVKLYEKVMGVDDNGDPILYVEGTHETDDEATLPTNNIYQGSLSMNLSSKEFKAFNGDTQTWD